MNLCSNHKILLWDVKNHGGFYTMNIRLADFYRLKGFTRKTGTRVVITGRYGLPFLSVKMWRRRIFLLGLVGSLLFWIFMSGFIWAVEISGNYYVTTDLFQDFMEESGIHTGMKKKNVDIEKLEEAIRTRFDIVTWTSARIEGTKLLIEVKENDVLMVKEEEKEAAGKGMDLVAEKDGVIVSIVTRTGVPKVAVGAEVKKGDILVEGGVPIYNEDGNVAFYDYCTADADIMLQSVYSYEESMDEKYEKKVYTGRKRRLPFLIIGTKDIRLPWIGKSYEQSDHVEEKEQLKIFKNYYLPVYFGSQLVREYRLEEEIYEKEQVRELFEERLQKFIETLQEKGVQIIEKNVTINKDSGVWRMKVDLLVVERAGEQQETTLVQIEEKAKPEENLDD